MAKPESDEVERPTPARALEAAFRRIERTQMQGLPMLNPALQVEAVGFRPWSDHWLGILITPWFMNLWLMPRIATQWQPIRERETRHCVFPAGVFEFIGGCDAALGDYQACSLFSPMFEFADQAEAHDTAVAALGALFERTHRDAFDPDKTMAPAHGPAMPPPRSINKRDFLFGAPSRGEHGPRR